MMIERIRREHGYMTRLLAILRSKLKLLKDEQPINYSLVKEIVDYLSRHSETIHHPKEDILYRYYMEHYGEHAEVADLEKEHVALSATTHSFLATIEMILNDAVVPQQVFIEQLDAFIESQRKHLEMEEQSILPMINRTFTVSDWKLVESQWNCNEEDPVFGSTIADRYAQLAQRVRKSEAEYN